VRDLRRIFFHITHAIRQADGDERRPLARRNGPNSFPRPSASAPGEWRSRAAGSGDFRGNSSQLASSSNRFSDPTDARLSVPTAMRTPEA